MLLASVSMFVSRNKSAERGTKASPSRPQDLCLVSSQWLLPQTVLSSATVRGGTIDAGNAAQAHAEQSGAMDLHRTVNTAGL